MYSTLDKVILLKLTRLVEEFVFNFQKNSEKKGWSGQIYQRKLPISTLLELALVTKSENLQVPFFVLLSDVSNWFQNGYIAAVQPFALYVSLLAQSVDYSSVAKSTTIQIENGRKSVELSLALYRSFDFLNRQVERRLWAYSVEKFPICL